MDCLSQKGTMFSRVKFLKSLWLSHIHLVFFSYFGCQRSTKHHKNHSYVTTGAAWISRFYLTSAGSCLGVRPSQPCPANQVYKLLTPPEHHFGLFAYDVLKNVNILFYFSLYSNILVLLPWKVRMHKEDEAFKKRRYISNDFFPVIRLAAASTQDRIPPTAAATRFTESDDLLKSDVLETQHLGGEAGLWSQGWFLKLRPLSCQNLSVCLGQAAPTSFSQRWTCGRV